MTTERIDVLAVIDNFIDPESAPHQPHDLSEARAAVAELIEAKQDAYYAWQMLAAICDTDPSTDRIKARDAAWRVYSTLARVGGA